MNVSVSMVVAHLKHVLIWIYGMLTYNSSMRQKTAS